MQSSKTRTILAAIAITAVLAVIFWVGRRPAETVAAPPPPEVKTAGVPEAPAPEFVDEYQRSIAIYNFKKAAQSGPDRGREIFYYKCWFCHNEFAGPQSAPNLANVFQRKQLLSGRPTTDNGIKDEIREGGAGMAAYKYTLSEADLDDLASYIREGCCWNSDSPPPNPRFRANGAD